MQNRQKIAGYPLDINLQTLISWIFAVDRWTNFSTSVHIILKLLTYCYWLYYFTDCCMWYAVLRLFGKTTKSCLPLKLHLQFSVKLQCCLAAEIFTLKFNLLCLSDHETAQYGSSVGKQNTSWTKIYSCSFQYKQFWTVSSIFLPPPPFPTAFIATVHNAHLRAEHHYISFCSADF